MTTVRIEDMVQNKVLVTRTSARHVGNSVAEVVVEPIGELELDFEGIRGITPSFFDELLLSISELAQSRGRDLRLRVINPPSELSSVHEAIGRAHGLSISESESGSWLVGRPEVIQGSDPGIPVQA